MDKRDETEVFRAWDRWVEGGGGDYRKFAGQWLEGVEWAGGRLTAAQGEALGGIVEGYVGAAMARHRKAQGKADGILSLQREFADLRLHDSVEDALKKDAEAYEGMSREEVAAELRRENGWFENLKRRLLDRRAMGVATELRAYLSEEERSELDRLFAGDGSAPEEAARAGGEPDKAPPIDWAGQEKAERVARVLRDGNIAEGVAEASPEALGGEDVRCLCEGLGSELCSAEEETLKKVYAIGLLGTMLPSAGDEAWEAWLCALFAGHRALNAITTLKAAVHRERVEQALQEAEAWERGKTPARKEG